MQIVTEIRLFRSLYSVCYISKEQFILENTEHFESIDIKRDFKKNETSDTIRTLTNILNKIGKKPLKICTNAMFLHPFVRECLNSDVYRENVLRNLNKLSGSPKNGTIHLKLNLDPPEQEIIDYAWNVRMLELVWSKVEIENAFSWLSTLGGAYSALGDYFDYCAEEAGKISSKQYKLSKMLGDEGLAARSKLYLALAYGQKGNLKLARHIIRNVAEFARTTHDERLNRMCQGVWVKLKYMKQCLKCQ